MSIATTDYDADALASPSCPCEGAFDHRRRDSGNHYVWIAFLELSNEDEEYWRELRWRDYMILPINYLACYLSNSWIFHCQLVFWNQLQSTYVTFSVDGYHDRVYMRDRKSFAHGWRFLQLTVTADQERRMYDFLRGEVALAKPFNRFGAYMMWWYPIDAEERAWFCSQLVVAALHRASLLVDVDPNATWASRLYSIVKDRSDLTVLETDDNPVRTKPVVAYLGRTPTSGAVAPDEFDFDV